MPQPAQPLTLWFLQNSRSIRTAWQLEILGLPWTLRYAEREADQQAPADFKAASGSPLGRFPALQDGDMTLVESGAIAEYLCDAYDEGGRLLPRAPAGARAAVLVWVHAAEATFMLHGLAISYARRSWPDGADPALLQRVEAGMAGSVRSDLDWLERTLAESRSGWILGGDLTLADVAVHLSVDAIFARRLGTEGRVWPKVEAWKAKCEAEDSFQRAKAKCSYMVAPKKK